MTIKYIYPMLRADSRFWLVNNRELWRRISRLTSSAWDIKTKGRHWWRHNGDSDRPPLSLPLRYDLVTLCLYGDLGQIHVIAGHHDVLSYRWPRFHFPGEGLAKWTLTCTLQSPCWSARAAASGWHQSHARTKCSSSGRDEHPQHFVM